MCVTHTAPIPQLSGLKARITRVTRETSIKKYGRKREIVSKVNRCNWPDSSIDEKRYTGKMEISALHPRNRNKIPTEGGAVDQTNTNQSNDLFPIDSLFDFSLNSFQFTFAIETFVRRKTSSFSSSFISFSYPPLCFLDFRPSLLDHRQTIH